PRSKGRESRESLSKSWIAGARLYCLCRPGGPGQSSDSPRVPAAITSLSPARSGPGRKGPSGRFSPRPPGGLSWMTSEGAFLHLPALITYLACDDLTAPPQPPNRNAARDL